ncbi:MAG: Gfo/Idh/MocA family oxidoreductase [Alphaproteobacteria bacterium]|nr:MAG: Gfo/Idh/MocA family oxidoreductase [Alphaproteobacteria bacterium]
MSTRLKVAIVGCEHCHVRGNSTLLEKRDDVEVVAVWGADPVRAAQFAARFGLVALDTLDTLPPVDLALVTTDTASHLPVMRLLEGRAGAVHLDKPLGLNAQDADAVAMLAAPYGERFAVGFFARLNPLVIELVSRVKAGEIGTLRHLAITFGHAGRLEGWLDDWPAFDDRGRMGYGAFSDMAAHALDIARLMLGDLTPLSCVKQWDRRYRLDVGGAALARSTDGTLVRLFNGSVMKGPRFEIRADGEAGSLWLRGKALGRYDANDEPEVLMRGDWTAAADSPRALIDRLLGYDTPAPVSAEDGLAINYLLDAFETLSEES